MKLTLDRRPPVLSPVSTQDLRPLTGGYNPLHLDEALTLHTGSVRPLVPDGETALDGKAWCYTFNHE